MVAGEASGDLLASLLLSGLRARWPDVRTFGIGGPRMTALQFDAWWPSDKLAVRGYVEVLRHYREIAGIRDALTQRLLRARPDAFIGVDAPDFNLGLAQRLREAGQRTIQFVCPSIWAWRAGRIKKIARAVDHVLCLFPFEPDILARGGVAATFVGHPLADEIPLQPPRAASRAALGIGEADVVVAVLPGSRRSEIEAIAPAFLQTVARLHAQRPDLRYLLPAAPGLRAMLDPLLAHAAGAPLTLVDGRSHEVLAACDVTLIASGTATLEAALFKRPMVIAYRMNALSWQIMRHMRLQPWVGLPNILCAEFVVPELLQHEATPDALARAVLQWLDSPQRCDALAARFLEIHQLLRRDTARTATDAIATILAC
ncbi:MAG TPA: lipid-A-disaccharide synthase [Burkholderiaceae bacterium]|nr:lipid-A-disaccharide synthase [Burkholderiaceae bacterium]HSB99144.1 lipid-A-disaccharide synthase [Burkholderiaceae bacterium]